MKLSAKGRSALHAMVDLLRHAVHGPVALHTISRRQRISLSHLEKMFADLRVHGLVVGVTGPRGGYLPARPAGQISAADVLDAVSPPAPGFGCGGEAGGRGSAAGACAAHDLWARLDDHLLGYLRSVTLEQLAATSPEAEPDRARPATRHAPSCTAG